MKLIKPSFEILNQEPGFTGLLKHIELCGRTAYKSEDKITKDSAPDFVNMLIKRNHGAVLEHGTIYLYLKNIGESSYQYHRYANNKYSIMNQASFVIRNNSNEIVCDFAVTTNYRVLVENNWLDDLKYQCEPTIYHEKRLSVKFIIDRGVSHEFVRHRVFSFIQESTRYCNYSKEKFGNEITFIIPSWSNLEELNWYYTMQDTVIENGIKGISINTFKNNLKFSDNSGEEHFCDNFVWIISLLNSEKYYLDLINRFKWTPQQARSVLPNSLKTELIMTGTLSEWKGFFKLRCPETAHPQAREVAIPLQEEFKKLNYL